MRKLLIVAAAFPAALLSGADRTFYMGFTPWPYGMTEQAVEDTYQAIARHGDMINHHLESVPWKEALSGEPFAQGFRQNIENRRKRTPKGHKVVLSISALDQGRKSIALYYGDKENMPLPPEISGKRFNDAVVEKAYFEYCRRMAEFFHPDYLVVGIETNELLNNSPQQWADYRAMSGAVRKKLKAAFPKIPVAESVTLHKLLEKGNRDLEGYRAEIREFVADHDFLAVSFYPFLAGLRTPEEFARALAFLKEFSKQRIAICETGHAAEDIVAETWQLRIPSSPSEQNDYVKALLEAASRDRYLFVNQWCWKDFDELWRSFPAEVKDLGRIFRDTGLVDEQNRERAAFRTWVSHFKRPRK